MESCVGTLPLTVLPANVYPHTLCKLNDSENVMANVLCVGSHFGLVHTHKLILESSGHLVFRALSNSEISTACHGFRIDVAVLSQTATPTEKQEWAQTIRTNSPSTKILELYLPNLGAALENADDWLPSSVEQRQLTGRITELAVGRSRTSIRHQRQV